MSPFSQYSLEQQYKRSSYEYQDNDRIYEDDFITQDLRDLQLGIYTTETAQISTKLQSEIDIESIVDKQVYPSNLKQQEIQHINIQSNKLITSLEIVQSEDSDSEKQHNVKQQEIAQDQIEKSQPLQQNHSESNINIEKTVSSIKSQTVYTDNICNQEQENIQSDQAQQHVETKDIQSNNTSTEVQSSQNNNKNEEEQFISFQNKEPDEDVYNLEKSSPVILIPQQTERPKNDNDLQTISESKSPITNETRRIQTMPVQKYDELIMQTEILESQLNNKEYQNIQSQDQKNNEQRIQVEDDKQVTVQIKQAIPREVASIADPDILYSSSFVDTIQAKIDQEQMHESQKSISDDSCSSIDSSLCNVYEEILNEYLPQCNKESLYENQANILKRIVSDAVRITHLQRAYQKYKILSIDDNIPEYEASKQWTHIAQDMVLLIVASQNTYAVQKILQSVQDLHLYIAIREIIQIVKQVQKQPQLAKYIALVSNKIDEDVKSEISTIFDMQFERLLVVLYSTVSLPCPMYFQYMYHVIDSKLITGKDTQIKFQLMRQLAQHFDYLIDHNNILQYLKDKQLKNMSIDEFVAVICFLDDNIDKFINKNVYINVLKSSLYNTFKKDKELYGKLINKHGKHIIKLFQQVLDKKAT